MALNVDFSKEYDIPKLVQEEFDNITSKVRQPDASTSQGNNCGSGSLSNVEARKWYLQHEAKIPDMIDSSLPFEDQTKQAYNLRNRTRRFR